MAASVSLARIEKVYGTKRTLNNVSLEVAAGEFLTLVGPSGCGKSTLLRIIAGLTPHDSGQVHIGERDVTALPARDRNVSMVFQSYALYPHMTVAENIATPLRMQRLPAMARIPLIGRFWPGSRKLRARIAQEVATVAAQVEIENLLHSRPAQLSGGQRQRVAVARAMVKQPGVFLMDEPLSNLDARLRVHMRAEISALHQRTGATFIYVTHDQVEAMTLSTRVAVVMDGCIVQVGTPRELYDDPQDIRVARFIGSPEMNILAITSNSPHRAWLKDASIQLPVQAADTVHMGFRPEHLKLADRSTHYGAHTLRIPALFERIEVLGHDALLFCRHPDSQETIVARAPVADVDQMRSRGNGWDKLTFEIDLAQTFWFDAQGSRLPPATSVCEILPLHKRVS
ncbi:glycerol-3-phosphate ABC transporter ATP-binding protein [Advenella kashmirensis W13003]|uniref:Glycerol-3-phosphate ABC transporter ATP-binding protein n=1 Tax=Advenella kashmirensis W13003 TaxID=1424334 RepID=V8QW39_9BURK|nr:ABC transporter ATP-binding protein [Advenella kashmirensis]ETF03877.1 glycerol-3-phosphate ABC transporter ATP-binding protein [Advenella kashmirensis W13003]